MIGSATILFSNFNNALHRNTECKFLLLNMHRARILFIGLLICSFCSQCVKNNAPVAPTQTEKWLMMKPWLLVYTDSVTIDSANTIHHYHSPALDCEKQEVVVFENNMNYFVQLVCNQPDSAKFLGVYHFSNDSTLDYESKAQANSNNVFAPMDIGFIEKISADTLKIIQLSSFASPGSLYPNWLERTYGH